MWSHQFQIYELLNTPCNTKNLQLSFMLKLPDKHQYFQTQNQAKLDIKKPPLFGSLRTSPKKMKETQREK